MEISACGGNGNFFKDVKFRGTVLRLSHLNRFYIER